MRPQELPELGVVKTATPCAASWDEMSGDHVKRFCTKCQRHVWNFAELTTEQARELLVATEGRLCGRVFTRGDGTVLTRDCPVATGRQRRRAVGIVAATTLTTAALLSVNPRFSMSLGGLQATLPAKLFDPLAGSAAGKR